MSTRKKPHVKRWQGHGGRAKIPKRAKSPKKDYRFITYWLMVMIILTVLYFIARALLPVAEI